MSKKQYNRNKKLEQSTLKEPQDFHPQVETWLTDNGYTFQHEVPMPEYGIADYIITAPDGKVSILECKWFTNNEFGRLVAQLLDYMRQMKLPGIMAIPALEADDWRRDVCKYFGVDLYEIPENPMVILKELKAARYASYKENITVMNSDEVSVFVEWHHFCSMNYAAGVFSYYSHSSVPMNEAISIIVDDMYYVLNHVAIPDMKRKLGRDTDYLLYVFSPNYINRDGVVISRSELYPMIVTYLKGMQLFDEYSTPMDYLQWIRFWRETYLREIEIAKQIVSELPDTIEPSGIDFTGKTLTGIVLDEILK